MAASGRIQHPGVVKTAHAAIRGHCNITSSSRLTGCAHLFDKRKLASGWWRYDVRDFASLDMQDAHGFPDGLADRAALGGVAQYKPRPMDIGASIKRIPAPAIRAPRAPDQAG